MKSAFKILIFAHLAYLLACADVSATADSADALRKRTLY
jgi:hypothetical protein